MCSDPPFLDPTWGVLATGSVKPMTAANQAKLSINDFFGYEETRLHWAGKITKFGIIIILQSPVYGD